MAHPMWVFVAGTYRSGSTTHYQMTRDIVEITNSGFGIGYHSERRLKDFDALNISDMAAISKTLKCHQVDLPYTEPPEFSRYPYYIVCKVFEFLPEGFRGETSHGEIISKQNRYRAIVSIRDPRDIAVSMRNRSRELPGKVFDFKKTVEDDFPVWLGNVQKWTDIPTGALVSRFEEFTKNLLREVRRIANYLDLPLTDEQQKTIARRYRIDEIRKRKDTYWQARGYNPELREDSALPSIPSLLFASSGQWERELTQDEANMVYEANKQFFERFGYK